MKKANCETCAFRSVCSENTTGKKKCKNYTEDITILPPDKLTKKLLETRCAKKKFSISTFLGITVIAAISISQGRLYVYDNAAEILTAAPQVLEPLKEIFNFFIRSTFLLLVICYEVTKAFCMRKQEKEEADVF